VSSGREAEEEGRRSGRFCFRIQQRSKAVIQNLLMKFFERFGFASREQRTFTFAVGGSAALVLVVLPLALTVLGFVKRSANDELRETLQKVQVARNDIRARNAKKDSIVQRYAKKLPALGGHIEQAAKAHKLEISDANDRQPIVYGKRYTERITVVHIKKCGLLPFTRMLESFEQSGSPISLSRLNMRKRAAEPNTYDVELGVSAFDREETKPADKPKDTKPADTGTGSKP
jgi:general secretion pathway protein M